MLTYTKTAVINETLRLAIGGSWRLPRISPNEDLVYKEHIIPSGVSHNSIGPLV